MAARKKAKSKAQRKKAPARKPAIRKKAVPARKKVTAKKKPAVRRVASRKKQAVPRVAVKKEPAAQPAPARKAPPVSAPSRPAEPAAPAAAPAALEGEERAGIVIHYFSQVSVAVVRLESGSLRLGDTIHITGHTSDFRQQVESLQIERQPVSEISAGQEFGLKVTQHAREHDIVYKVTPQP